MESQLVQQTITYLILALFLARIMGLLAERIGQPPVLGELAAGVILGAGMLSIVKGNPPILFLGTLGSILLLFQIGLETEADDLRRVGASAFTVAAAGVIGPFVSGYFISRLFGMSQTASVFLGATLTATSVGITCRVLKDLRRLNTVESHIILGAAIVDDILGLIILAVVGSITSVGSASIFGTIKMIVFAVAFLALALFVGVPLAPRLHGAATKLRSIHSLAWAALVFCFVLSLLADKLNLSPIVGAFAAGLILANIEHREHIQTQIAPIANFLVPIFFVTVGLTVDFSLLNPFAPGGLTLFCFTAALLAAAVLFKILAGMAVVQKQIRRLVVGIGMVPRGEVGLIFASVGLSRGIIDVRAYAVVVAIVVITTFITPPLLKRAFSREKRLESLQK